MAPPVRAVAFDYGGVLIPDAFAALAELEAELGLAPGALGAEFRGGPLFSQCEIGQLSARDFFTHWGRRLREEHGVDPTDRVKELFRRAQVLQPGVVEIVQQLAGRYRLAVITNNVAETRGHWERSLPAGCFEVLVDSSEVGLRKPDPKIYDVLLDRLGLPGPEVVLVDDWEPNLEPARALGMHAIHFTGVDTLVTELAALGINIGAGAGREA